MDGEPDTTESRGIPDALREAVGKTVNASAEALDEVSRRSREARDNVSQRGQEASAGLAARVTETVEGMRLPTRDDVRELEQQVAELSRRVAALESEAKSNPKVDT